MSRAPQHSRRFEYGSPYCGCYRCRAEVAEMRLEKEQEKLSRLRVKVGDMRSILLEELELPSRRKM